jgi:glycine cleavage system H protein
MNFPNNLKYTKDHEWIRVEDNVGFVGITDYAQGELGDVVFVEINKDAILEQGKPFGTIEAVKAVSELFAPVSGGILEVNPAIADMPELVNKDPYGEGWMIKIEINDANELNTLMDAGAYRAMVGK